METIQIKNDDEKTLLYIEGKKYWGYTFYNDGRVTAVDENIFKSFDMFILSKNQTKLPDENNYQVILDNETNFKHYFLNGKEDFLMLFLNNGEDAVAYSTDDEEKSEDKGQEENNSSLLKRFVHKNREIIIKARALFLGIVMFFSYLTFLPEVPISRDINKLFYGQVAMVDDLTVEQVISMINSSPKLQRQEKELLSNRKLFEFILNYSNQYGFTKFMYGQKLNKISIEKTNGVSHYSQLFNSTLFINDYRYYDDYMFSNFVSHISHEFIHMLQEGFHYNVLTEALADILSSEFFEGGHTSYSYFVQRTYKLMEIIGTEPIIRYVLGDDFGEIEKNVKPYLSIDEYNSFKNCLHVADVEDGRSKEKNEKMAKLDELLNKMYFNKFGKEPDENEPFKLCESPWFVKYYFNDEHFTQEESYCYKIHCIFPEGTDLSEIVEYVKTNKEYQKILIKRYQEEGESECPLFPNEDVPSYLKAAGIDDIAIMYEGIFLKGEKVFFEPSKKLTQNQGKGFN